MDKRYHADTRGEGVVYGLNQRAHAQTRVAAHPVRTGSRTKGNKHNAGRSDNTQHQARDLHSPWVHLAPMSAQRQARALWLRPCDLRRAEPNHISSLLFWKSMEDSRWPWPHRHSTSNATGTSLCDCITVDPRRARHATVSDAKCGRTPSCLALERRCQGLSSQDGPLPPPPPPFPVLKLAPIPKP